MNSLGKTVAKAMHSPGVMPRRLMSGLGSRVSMALSKGSSLEEVQSLMALTGGERPYEKVQSLMALTGGERPYENVY